MNYVCTNCNHKQESTNHTVERIKCPKCGRMLLPVPLIPTNINKEKKMKLQISVLYNSGVEKIYKMVQTNNDDELTKEDLQEAYKCLEDEYIHKVYNSGINGYLHFVSDEGESISVHLNSTSEIRFKVVEY